MRHPKGNKYCSNESELLQYQRELKFVSCPHCGQVGFLICHGFLCGYAETGQEIAVRGRRIFCSNRYRRRGCGRTFSVLLADVLRGFVVRAGTLWRFVLGVIGGLSRKASWERVQTDFSLESGYRLWRRIQGAQSRIRELLCRERPPPQSFSDEPLFQLVTHLQCVFASDQCPFAGFQTRFQTAVLG